MMKTSGISDFVSAKLKLKYKFIWRISFVSHCLSLPQYRTIVEAFVTFYEIYCGKVFDLLNNKKRLRVLEDQKGLVQVLDRKQQQVKSVQDVLNIIQSKSNIYLSFSFKKK